MSRPSVKACSTTSAHVLAAGQLDQRAQVVHRACTPPSETSPSRCSRARRPAAPRAAPRSRRTSRPRSPRRCAQVLLDDRARAQVEVADLGVAHLALGQPDGRAPGRQRRVRPALPELVEDRRVGQLDGVARAGLGASPQPSSTTHAARRRQPARPGAHPPHGAAAATIRGERRPDPGWRRPPARRRRPAGPGSRPRCRA